MAEETTTFNFRQRGAQATAAQLSTLRQSIARLDQASRRLQTRVTGVASASSAMGTAISQVNPQMGRFASVLGTAGGAVSGLTTAIGGVGGLAVGGLVAALGLYLTHLKNTADETKNLKKATDALGESLEGTIAQLQKIRKASDLRSTVETGQGSVAEQRAFLLERTRMLSEVESAIADPKFIEEREALGRQRQDLRREIAQAKRFIEDAEFRTQNKKQLSELGEQISQASDLGIGPDEKEKSKGSESPFGKSTLAGRLEFEAQKEALDRAVEHNKERSEFLTRVETTEAEKRIALARETAEAKVEATNNAADAIREAEARTTEQLIRNEERAAMARQQSQQLAVQGAQALAGVMGGVFQDIAAGQKVTAEAVIAGIGSQLISLGTSWIMQGTANLLLGNPGGPALIGLGLLAQGTGAAMGAAASDSRSAGGAASSAPARPTPLGQERDQGPRTIVYQNNISALVADERAGLAVARAQRRAKVKFGSNAVKV